jgi:hypothetical protein
MAGPPDTDPTDTVRPAGRRARYAPGLRIAAALAVVALCVWVASQLDFSQVAATLRQARGGYLVLAVLAVLLGMLVQAQRIQALLQPTRVISVPRMLGYLFMSNAASNLIPARAGDVLRIFLLRAREGVPAVTTLAAMVVERVLEGVVLVLLLLPAPLLIPTLPPFVAEGLTWALVALVGGALTALLVVRLLRGRAARFWNRPFLMRLRQGGLALRQPRLLVLSAASALLAWLLEAVSITVVLLALDVEAPPYAAMMVLLTINLAVLVPSTPAQVGAFELGAVAGLRLVGVPEEQAVAAAVLCHAVQFFPVTLLGLVGLPTALRAQRAAPES